MLKQMFCSMALVATFVVLPAIAQEPRPKALPLYPNVEKAIELFLVEWSQSGEAFLPATISLFKSKKSYSYKLMAFREKKKAKVVTPRNPTFGGGSFRFSQRGEDSTAVSVVFEPKTKSAESVSQNEMEGHAELKIGPGFAREQSFSRSYSRSYVSNAAPSEEGDEISPRLRPRLSHVFSLRPSALVYLFDDEEDFETRKAEIKSENRLIRFGAASGPDGILSADYYYLVVKEAN